MKELEKQELLDINGGGVLSAAFLTAVVRGVQTIMDIGRSVGTAARRYFSGNVCSF